MNIPKKLMITMKALENDLIFFSQGKGIARVVTNQGTFYGKTLYDAMIKAILYKEEISK
ncbi:MAG: hypothetical protein KQ78_01911 [Candidatus Izimaplasma bacterium HR2]|nr:MAG: hypothetical protein KQ78_01911 [Candidatus Izimaplasma bacterium HR2]